MVGNRQADAPNGAGDREALRLAYQLMSQRVSHFEQLILGMATVGMAGWGLLLAGPSTESVDSPGRFMFVAVFSGMVASAFSGLYMARCSFNRVVFRIEAALELAQPGHLGYFLVAGKLGMRSFYFTALFIPAMSLGALVYAVYQAWGKVPFDGANTASVLLSGLWTISVYSTVASTVLNIKAIQAVFHDFRKLSKERTT